MCTVWNITDSFTIQYSMVVTCNFVTATFVSEIRYFWFPKEMGWKQTVREPDPQERGFAIYVEWCRLQKTCKTKVRAFDTFACIVCHKCL